MEEDYRKYDRIWQRVSPELNPYPEVRAAQGGGAPEAERRLLTLPGAESDPCCMGSAAQEETAVIEGFLRDLLADVQIYRCLARCAPTQAACRAMRRLASEGAEQVRTLQSVYFLITGRRYCVTVVLPPQPKLPWCDRLRGRYHEEACHGFNLARAAEETTDVCLRRIMGRLSRSAYRRAEQLRMLLEKAL